MRSSRLCGGQPVGPQSRELTGPWPPISAGVGSARRRLCRVLARTFGIGHSLVRLLQNRLGLGFRVGATGGQLLGQELRAFLDALVEARGLLFRGLGHEFSLPPDTQPPGWPRPFVRRGGRTEGRSRPSRPTRTTGRANGGLYGPNPAHSPDRADKWGDRRAPAGPLA